MWLCVGARERERKVSGMRRLKVTKQVELESSRTHFLSQQRLEDEFGTGSNLFFLTLKFPESEI